MVLCDSQIFTHENTKLGGAGGDLGGNRVSKTHKHTNAYPRKICFNLRKTLTLERKAGKTGTFVIFFG